MADSQIRQFQTKMDGKVRTCIYRFNNSTDHRR